MALFALAKLSFLKVSIGNLFMQKNSLNFYKYVESKFYKNSNFIIFIFLIFVSFNFTSASLTGDAKQILELLFSNFYIKKNSFIDLLLHKEMLPHRWFLAIIIGIPIGALEIFNFPIELNLKMSLISFVIAYLFTFLYLITPVIIFSSMANTNKNKNVAMFLVVTFFGTSYLQFSNFKICK